MNGSTVIIEIVYWCVLLVVAAPLLLGPILVKFVMTFTAQPRFTVVRFEDGRIPAEAKAFLQDVSGQMQKIGFEPPVYLINDEPIPNTKGYLAMFRNESARDTAAAMAVFSEIGGTMTAKAFVAEFSTDYVDGTMVDTSNNSDPESLFQLSWKRTWKFPTMRDLGLLYQAHQAHIARAGGSAKREIPAPYEWPADLSAAMLREYQSQCEAGCLKRVKQNQAFAFTWRGAILGCWGLIWPISAIRRARIRREARTHLAEHDLTVDYETINYKAWVKESAAQFQTYQFPRQAVQAPQAKPVNEPLTFPCPACGGTIATYETPGSHVVCPLCQQHVTTQESS